MQGKTHLVIGAAAGLASVATAAGGQAATPVTTLAIGAVIGGVAGLIPDWLQINVPGASKQIKGAFGHRGFSHWAWAALAAAYAARLVWEPAAWPVLAGWMSHIILDAMASGVPMFWPFGRVTLARVKTGGKLDTAIGAVGLILIAMAIIMEVQ
jgi:membrane-bound metal-dependent hydrolase YbcI (DUF457 family)